MKLKAFAVGLTFSLALVRADQTIEQWAPAKWGMTEQQVLGAFQGAARVLPTGKSDEQFKDLATVGIDDVAIAGVPLQALFLFDKSGKLNRIHLSPPKRVSPTDDQFRTIEDLLARKYGEPKRSAGETRYLSVWMLSRSVVELNYDRPVSLSLEFLSNGAQSPESLTQGLGVVQGSHVFSEPLTLPPWLSTSPRAQENKVVATADHLHISYEASAPLGDIVGHYKSELASAARAGVTYSEGSNDSGGALIRASLNRTSCSVQANSTQGVPGAHVEVDCVRRPDPNAAPPSIAISRSQPTRGAPANQKQGVGHGRIGE